MDRVVRLCRRLSLTALAILVVSCGTAPVSGDLSAEAAGERTRALEARGAPAPVPDSTVNIAPRVTPEGGPAVPEQPADEVAELVRELRPPARFAGYSPRWSVVKETCTFRHMEGPKTETFRMVKDGERYVAMIRPKGEVHQVAFRPAEAPTVLPLPKGRYHFDTYIGSIISTDAFIGSEVKEKDASYEWRRDGERLVLTRRYAGERKQKRKRKDRKPGESKHEEYTQTVDAANTFVFRVDPVHGYVIEGTYDAAVSPKPDGKGYAMGWTPGAYSLRPGTERCQRMFFTPVARGGYDGWYCNLKAMDICDRDKKDYVARDGGFVGYLDNETGWSVALTVSGGDAGMATCNAHANFIMTVKWPDEVEPDARGLHRHVVRHRLLALPPELTRHIWDDMNVRYRDMKAVMIRIGVPEDFEEQPVSVATNTRGIISTGGLKLTSEHARSGTKSLVVKGRVWPNLPQIILAPRSSYRLEAWVMSEDEGAEVYMTAHLYEWSPHSNKWWREQKTNVVRGGRGVRGVGAKEGGGWKRIAIDFDTPEWDPFVDVRFHCEGGTAYLDDFSLTKTGPAAE